MSLQRDGEILLPLHGRVVQGTEIFNIPPPTWIARMHSESFRNEHRTPDHVHPGAHFHDSVRLGGLHSLLRLPLVCRHASGLVSGRIATSANGER